MNVQEYIDSGVLYDYCTNVLSAEQRAAVEQHCAEYPAILASMQEVQQALSLAPRAPEAMRDTIWSSLENINKERAGDLTLLPVINKYSDHTHWQHMVMPFMPAQVPAEREIVMLRNSGGITQMLVVTRTDVAEESHHSEKESFLILEGECECHLGGQVVRLGPGGFLDVPLHTLHRVRVLSPYVVAVLQVIAV